VAPLGDSRGSRACSEERVAAHVGFEPIDAPACVLHVVRRYLVTGVVDADARAALHEVIVNAMTRLAR